MSEMQWAAPSAFPAVYEELNVSGFFRTFSELLLDLAQPGDGERMLDVATGTGIVLREAHARTPGLASSVGLDLTPGMLDVARERSSGLDIEYVLGDATGMPFADDESFDLLTCQQGLQFFPDRPAALREFHRVLAAGGRAVVACWCDIATAPGHSAFAEVIGERLPDLAGASRNPFSLPDAAELERLLGDAGFDDVRVERVTADARFATVKEFVRSYMYGTPIAVALGGFPEATRDEIAHEVERRIEGFGGGEPVALPMATNIAVGIRRR